VTPCTTKGCTRDGSRYYLLVTTPSAAVHRKKKISPKKATRFYYCEECAIQLDKQADPAHIGKLFQVDMRQRQRKQ
jgi:hypothetical protein